MSAVELKNQPTPVEIKSGNSALKVNPQGALIEQLKLAGKDIFWTGTRPDGKKAASHFSLPWFGPFKGNLPDSMENPGYHGPSRKDEWQLYAKEQSNAQLIYKIKGLENIYPNLHAFASFFVAEKSFIQLLTLDNRSVQQQENINPGLHWYWNVQGPELENISINGDKHSLEEWKSATLLPVKTDNFIHIPSLGKIELEQKGFSNIIIWTQTDKDNQALFGCIELGNDPDKITNAKPMQSGEFKHYSAKITLLE